MTFVTVSARDELFNNQDNLYAGFFLSIFSEPSVFVNILRIFSSDAVYLIIESRSKINRQVLSREKSRYETKSLSNL